MHEFSGSLKKWNLKSGDLKISFAISTGLVVSSVSKVRLHVSRFLVSVGFIYFTSNTPLSRTIFSKHCVVLQLSLRIYCSLIFFIIVANTKLVKNSYLNN